MNSNKIQLIFGIATVIFVFMVWRYSWKIQLMFNTGGMGTYTPENFTGISTRLNEKRASELRRRFLRGSEIAKTKSIVIAGMLRNAEKSIPAIRRKTETLGSAFAEYHIIILENDSSDNTRKLLLKWATENSRVKILGCGINADKCNISGSASKATEGHSVYRGRIEKMVKLRNIYLDHIRETPERASTDFTAIWDLDTIGSVYLDGILDTVYELSTSRGKKLSAVCAHGVYRWAGSLKLYYDTYAHLDFDDDFHIDDKLSHDIRTGLVNGVRYSRGDDLVYVKSCFSGFTMYRTADLIKDGVSYSLTPESEGNLECEHVRLNNSLREAVTTPPNNGSDVIAVNPNMVNLVVLNE